MSEFDLTSDADATDVMSPAQWRDHLVAKLLKEIARNRERKKWYLGKQPTPDVPAKYSEAYRLLLKMSRNAWARLIVDAISERVTIEGVRLKGDESDLDIWRMLKLNHLDVDQRLTHSEALTFGTSYYSVWPDEDRESGVLITPESGIQVTHEPDPEDRRQTLAAVKAWRDDVRKRLFCTLYLRDQIYRWEAPLPDKAVSGTDDWKAAELAKQWKPRGEDDGVVVNVLDAIPIVPIENRPTLFAGASSEIDDLEPVLRRTDKLMLDMLLAAEVGAFVQKWATGLKVPKDPITNKPVEPYDAAITKLWVSDNPSSKFGSFQATSLEPYLKAIDAQVAQLSAISRVPSYYLISPSLVNPPSADTLLAAEAGLIRKAESLMGYWGESYEALIRLALKAKGDDRANELGLEVVWADAAMPNEAAQADAATKWATLGIPQEILWERAGASPEDIARWKAIAAREALTQAVLAPATTVDEAEAVGDEQEQADAAEQAQQIEQ